MATVQHLEKLLQIKEAFDDGDTLECTVAGERVAQLIARTEKLIYQRTFLRDERRRLRMSTEMIEEKKKALALMARGDWIPQSIEPAATENHLRINIGGLMFEAPISILQRDKDSLLAQLCNPEPPILPDPDGFFYFDRDWWLFRYIITFLRDGTLPDDRNLLAQLYKEAAFWNMKELQIAIEENKLHLRTITKPDDKLWWRQLPSWWQAIDEAKKKAEEESNKAKPAPDWWKDTSYNGKVFLPLSTALDKVVTKPGEKDELPGDILSYSTTFFSKK